MGFERLVATGMCVSLLAATGVAWPASAQVYSLAASNPENSVIEIYNDGPEELVFRIVSLNSRQVFQTENEVAAAVLATPTEFPDHSVPTQAFRFITNNRYHEWELTLQFDWYLSPTLFFNSAGVALCGESSDMFVDLLTRLGIPARVWALDGHVAAEAFWDGRWQYYDTDFGVFYLNHLGEVASLADLQNDPSLIVNPLYPMEYAPSEVGSPYHPAFAALLISEPNVIGGDLGPPIPAEELVFRLPVNAKLQFPSVFADPPKNLNGGVVPNYQNLKVSYPPGFSGAVSHFLILHDIQGDGAVKIGTQTYEAGSQQLFDKIDARTEYIQDIDILETGERVDVVYLLNPQRWQLAAQNELVLDVVSGSQPRVSVVQLPAEVPALSTHALGLVALFLLGVGSGYARIQRRPATSDRR